MLKHPPKTLSNLEGDNALYWLAGKTKMFKIDIRTFKILEKFQYSFLGNNTTYIKIISKNHILFLNETRDFLKMLNLKDKKKISGLKISFPSKEKKSLDYELEAYCEKVESNKIGGKLILASRTASFNKFWVTIVKISGDEMMPRSLKYFKNRITGVKILQGLFEPERLEYIVISFRSEIVIFGLKKCELLPLYKTKNFFTSKEILLKKKIFR